MQPATTEQINDSLAEKSTNNEQTAYKTDIESRGPLSRPNSAYAFKRDDPNVSTIAARSQPYAQRRQPPPLFYF